jgi:hypothetical protein
MNSHDEVRAFITDPVLQQRLAKYMVLQCFRNSMLEDLHAGISPSSASGDYSVNDLASFGIAAIGVNVKPMLSSWTLRK